MPPPRPPTADDDPAARAGLVPAPRQERSRASYERILDATEHLLEEHAFEDLSVAEILDRAGVSNGSFYARFGTKDAVLQSLFARYREDLARRVREVLGRVPEDASLAERVDALVRAQLDRMRARRGLLRTLALQRRARSDAVTAEERATLRAALRDAERFLLERADEIAHEDPRRAVRCALFVLSAALRDRVLFSGTPHASLLGVGVRPFAGELSRMLAGYLLTPQPRS